jgi:hypothetical protein
MTRNEQDAEDVVQESFIRAYRQLGRFEARANFATMAAPNRRELRRGRDADPACQATEGQRSARRCRADQAGTPDRNGWRKAAR